MRLFIAVNFTDDFKNSIIDYRNKLREFKDDSHINWTTDENLHLTLAFIGEYRDVGRVKEALDSIEFKPFTIKTNGSGNFGSLRWVGVTENAVKLSEKVRAALDEYEIPYDDKPMKPHITVAREMIVDRKKVNMLPRVVQSSMKITEISLMKSERIKGKLTYTEIYSKKAEDIYE